MPAVLWRCWLGGRKGIRPVKKLSRVVLAWLSLWSKLQTCMWPSWCHCHSLSLASAESRLVLSFWYQFTRVVPDRGPLNVCVLHTHTHTRLTAICLGLPGSASTRKVQSIWILLKQETVGGSGISWAICKSAPRSRQITTPAPHHWGRMPFLSPNQQRQSTEGMCVTWVWIISVYKWLAGF